MPDTIPAGPGPWNAAAGCGTPNPGFTAVATGTATTPVGPTGPTGPTGGPTGPTGGPTGPTGSPGPAGLTLSEVLSDVNAEFATLEALNPFLARLLKQVNAAVDLKIASMWPPGARWENLPPKNMLAIQKLSQARNALAHVDWGAIGKELPIILDAAQTLAPVLLKIWQELSAKSSP